MFEYLVFDDNDGVAIHREVRIEVDGDNLRYRIDGFGIALIDSEKRSGVYMGDVGVFVRKLESFDVPNWKDEYYIPACDGYSWDLRYKEVGKPCRKITGSNDCPDCFEDFVDLLYSVSRDFWMLDYLRYTESENGVLFRKYELRFRDGQLIYKFTGPYFNDEELGEHVYEGDFFSYLKSLEEYGFNRWEDPFYDIPMLDGIDWILEYRFSDEPARMVSGSNKGPKNIQGFVFALNPENISKRHIVL